MYKNFGWKYSLIAFIVLLWGFALFWKVDEFPLGLDLRGGDELIYRLDFGGKPPTQKVTEDAVNVLRDRIDTLGVKELSIRSLGVDKIVVQIPGATESETEKIMSQIERAGKLQFKILISDQISDVARKAEIARILRQKQRGTWNDESDRYDIAVRKDVRRSGDEGQEVYELLYHRSPGTGKPEYVDGGLLEDAYRALDDKGRPCVGFTWNSVGKKRFYSMTEKNTNRQLAVVLDGELRSAPVIKTAIGKRGIIEGGEKGWDEKELNALIVILKAGALPAKPVLAYKKKVGAQLGQQAVKWGAASIAGAMFVVVLFMVWYYRVRSGIIADIALTLNLFLILGTLSMFDATLTLPGIAGILLTAGMAVDANILIFERIREELARGAAVKQAIQAGYDRAFWTIFDANLTTALTAVVLMWVGTGPIKGFGLTLTIGIVVSMFTALFVTRALFGFFVVKEVIKDVKFRQLFDRPKFDFWSANKKALTCSLTLIAVGWLVFISRGQEKYGIDFTGGTVLAMRLKDPVEKKAVEKLIDEHFKKRGDRIQVEVQSLGELEKTGIEMAREWQLRTRRVEAQPDAPAADAKTAKTNKTASILDALISPAYGQDKTKTGEEAKTAAKTGEEVKTAAKTDAKTGEEDKTAAKTGEDKTAAKTGEEVKAAAKTADDAKTLVAPPARKKTVDPKAAAKAKKEADSRKGAQDFFEVQIRDVFKQQLVNPYPVLNGKPFEVIPAGAGKARLRMRVDLVDLARSKDKPLDQAKVNTELRTLFRALAAKLDAKKNKQQIKDLRALAGSGEGDGFKVELLKDDDPNDGLTPFVFTTHPVDDFPKVHLRVIDALKQGLEKVQDLSSTFAPAKAFPDIDTVGSAVAKNLKSKALIATFFCVVFICLYVWLRFDFWSGIAAIVAVFHDVLALLGFLAILDWVLSQLGLNFDAKFNLTTISAFLTLVGYSINDTIVILDRIREDKHLAKAKEYTPELVNGAINKTLMRTVLTSLTSWLVCLVLFGASFGGLASIQGLSVALLFGVAVGTYSSMFIAAPILLMDKRKLSLSLYGIFGFLILSGLVSAGLHEVAGVMLAVLVAIPFGFAKLGGPKLPEPAKAGKKKGKK